jgi:hypothetical protein
VRTVWRSTARAGIVYNDHTEEDGATVFRHACKLGFEGIVSKRLTAPLPIRTIARLDQGQEPGQPGDGETSGGAVVRKPKLKPIVGKSWKRLVIIATKPSTASNWHGS